ncbi:MAG: DMT family transporter [Rhizobiales bacterium]|nr:DMT family transporter [Hyphomicrobiales bacterium]MBO6698643.1 DMT family transporter [Hyphomicrobiales bacterium]MBO6735104.1 DMT family transporter [Hyphomicrobiales bacterium]MBO6911089.1 DMT family transporter [Hyphomicrobiales bacterium]MBO6957010.1 DMT family transporter [Hyphomicrobiales bacterium]
MTLTPNTRGIIATCLAMVGFIGTDSCIKLASQDLPISQMIALRGIAILAILVAMAFATGAHKALPTFKDKAVGLRAFGECMATLLYYNAIIAIPIANANAVLQTIPLVIVAVAALFFGEKVGWRRWLMILVGFSGVLLIIQPGGDGFMPASLWAVAAVIFFVIRDMATRYIDPRLPAVSINLVTSASVMVMGFILAFFQDWVILTPQALALLGLSACFLTMGYLAVTVAMRSGDVSVTSPFRYSIVLWALGIDAIVFGNRPDLTMIVGLTIVVASGIYMIVRERQINQSKDATHSSS